MVNPRVAANGTEEQGIKDRLEEILGDRTGPEVALVARLVSGFPAKAARFVEGALHAASNGDAEGAARQLHGLSGAASNLGALELPRRCAEVEDLVRSGACGEVTRHGAALRREVHAFVETLARAVPGGVTGSEER